MSITGLLSIFLAAILTNNYILSKFLGICPFLGVSKKLDTAVSMSAAVIVVMVVATAVTWPIQTLLLDPLGLGYLQTIVFILIIAALVQFIETFMKKNMPPLYQALGVYLPLITTNCAVLGIALTNVQNYNTAAGLNIGQKLLDSVVSGLGTAVGFTIAIIIMAGIRERNEFNDVPESFKGMPIVLLTAGLMAIAFFGFSGII